MQIRDKNMFNSGDFDLLEYTKEKMNKAFQEEADQICLAYWTLIKYVESKDYKKENYVTITPLTGLKLPGLTGNRKVTKCVECPYLMRYADGIFTCKDGIYFDFKNVNVENEVHELCLFRFRGKTKCK